MGGGPDDTTQIYPRISTLYKASGEFVEARHSLTIPWSALQDDAAAAAAAVANALVRTLFAAPCHTVDTLGGLAYEAWGMQRMSSSGRRIS